MQALIDIKTNATFREPWKSNLTRLLNFCTPNHIPEEKKLEIYMEKTFIWRPERQVHDIYTW